MKSVENILVPIDFSDESIVGLNAGIDMAKRFNANIHLTHFVFPNAEIVPKHPKEEILGITETVYESQLQNVRQETYDKLKQVMIDSVPEMTQGHVCIVGSSLSNLFEEFTKESNVDVDLIVVGTSGTRNMVEYFIGNSTDTVIRNTQIPLLAISEGEDLAIKNVLLITDLSSHHPDKEQQFCRSLQKSGSTIHLGHIITTELITKEEIQTRSKQGYRPWQRATV